MMTNHRIDLRSDTVTRPTAQMKKAMQEAEVGDDYYRTDPTVQALEEKSAEILGKEAALLVLSGTMGNLVSILAQSQPGQSVILGDNSHILMNEAGGLSALGGLLARPVPAPNGIINVDDAEKALLSARPLSAPTRMLCAENTHNAAGGRALSAQVMNQLCTFAHNHDLKVHIDGARLFNAAIASGHSAAALVELAIVAEAALSEQDMSLGREHLQAIERIAPTLRTLRHSDGGLARFHGGGRGAEGRLDHALANSGVRHGHSESLSMGYARLSAGRTSVIIDAAPPPTGRASRAAHASTLAFELTSGRRPLIVNCGSGAYFGPDWQRAGRATPSHSTLCLQGQSSARVSPSSDNDVEILVDSPRRVPVRITQAPDGLRFQGGHDGYLKTHGLTHARTLELTFDGRAVAGEELLIAMEDDAKRRFDHALDATGLKGLPYQVRFHLHPDVEAQLDMGGVAVSLALKSGELWVFRHDGKGELRLEPSVFLEKNRLKPRATTQIVLSSRALEHANRIRWSLSKAQDTPISIRDLNRDGMDVAF